MSHDQGWIPKPTDADPGAMLYVGNPQSHQTQELAGETQDSIGAWSVATFGIVGDDSAPIHSLRLLEEVIELCRADGASWREISGVLKNYYPTKDSEQSTFELWKNRDPQPDKIGDEAADCEILLKVYAHRRGLNLARETNKKMVRNRARQWRLNDDGTGQHIAEPGEEIADGPIAEVP